MLAGKAKGEIAQALREASNHSGCLPAVLPPPEEEKDVKTAIGAARAKQERSRMKKAS
jgi:hypothetical protein